MIDYNKDEIKNSLSLQDVYDVVEELGGEPLFTDFGLTCLTICHNSAHSGSRKLYYYENTRLFRCYTGCQDTFDIFDLIIKSKKIENNEDLTLTKAMYFILRKFNLINKFTKDEDDFNKPLQDWEFLNHYEHINQIELKDIDTSSSILPEFNKIILSRFLYPRIPGWEKEGINMDIMRKNFIGYYPGDEQITIPHFDENNRLIGIRGRSLVSEEAETYGKYRPLKINGILYNHPLRLNLYNYNNSKNNIIKSHSAIVFEGE